MDPHGRSLPGPPRRVALSEVLHPLDDPQNLPNPRFRDYWPRVETYLRFTTQDTGSVDNYVVCWRQVEAPDDPIFGVLGDLPLRAWTRTTALRTLRALAGKADGEPALSIHPRMQGQRHGGRLSACGTRSAPTDR